MSDLHSLPLRGHDLPLVRARRKARVYQGAYGWHWEHECSTGWWKNSEFPYALHSSALEGALRHLERCR